jgi:hypothetical protein
MKQHGYKRQGKGWCRRVADGWLILSPQSSSSSTRDYLKFTFNLGAHSDLVARLSNETIDETKAPSESSCHLRQRIGLVMPEHNDKWWGLADHHDLALLTVEVNGAISSFALPFLESVSSNAALVHRRGLHAVPNTVCNRPCCPRPRGASPTGSGGAQIGKPPPPRALDHDC